MLLIFYLSYLYQTINTCSSLSFIVFTLSEINNYIEIPLSFNFEIPILENIIDRNCPYISRDIKFNYDESKLKKCMNQNCLDVYHNNSTKEYFWCAIRFSKELSCPMNIFKLADKAYEIDPRFAGDSGHSTAMKILTNITQDGLLLMTSKKYVTPFHSAATTTHHILLRGKKIWCFMHSQARSILKINMYTDIPIYSSYDIVDLYHDYSYNCVVQNVGDMIYLPPYVYHFVYSFENTIALTTHHTNDIIHASRSFLFDKLYTSFKNMTLITNQYRQNQLKRFEDHLLSKFSKISTPPHVEELKFRTIRDLDPVFSKIST